MEMPKVSHTYKDTKNDLTYVVMAYRKLTEDEFVRAVVYFRSQQKRKPKRGSQFVIMTMIGARDPLR